MEPSNFYIEHFSDLCCYEDYLMRVDLLGKAHNDEEVLNSLPICDNHRYIVAEGEIIWIGNDGEKVDNPNITCIPDQAFRYWGGIRGVVIPTGVITIGHYAFSGCRKLKSVNIPNSVTIIGEYAFSWCYGLTSVTIPDSVTSIGNHVFYGCRGLLSLTIPSSVKSIGFGAFFGCDKLKSISVPKECMIDSFAPIICNVIRY